MFTAVQMSLGGLFSFCEKKVKKSSWRYSVTFLGRNALCCRALRAFKGSGVSKNFKNFQKKLCKGIAESKKITTFAIPFEQRAGAKRKIIEKTERKVQASTDL